MDDLETRPKDSNTVYGVQKVVNGNLLIGDRAINFYSDGSLILDGDEAEVFKPTPGLLELILIQYLGNYTVYDREKFQRVVTLTNLHRYDIHSRRIPESNRSH